MQDDTDHGPDAEVSADQVERIKALVRETRRHASGLTPAEGRCWLLFHRWSKWFVGVRPGYYSMKCQQRHCLRCGLVQTKG